MLHASFREGKKPSFFQEKVISLLQKILSSRLKIFGLFLPSLPFWEFGEGNCTENPEVIGFPNPFLSKFKTVCEMESVIMLDVRTSKEARNNPFSFRGGFQYHQSL